MSPVLQLANTQPAETLDACDDSFSTDRKLSERALMSEAKRAQELLKAGDLSGALLISLKLRRCGNSEPLFLRTSFLIHYLDFDEPEMAARELRFMETSLNTLPDRVLLQVLEYFSKRDPEITIRTFQAVSSSREQFINHSPEAKNAIKTALKNLQQRSDEASSLVASLLPNEDLNNLDAKRGGARPVSPPESAESSSAGSSRPGNLPSFNLGSEITDIPRELRRMEPPDTQEDIDKTTAFNNLLDNFLREGQIDKAITLFQNARNLGDLRPDLTTFNTVLRLYAEKVDRDCAFITYLELRKSFSPNAETFKGLFWLCSVLEDHEQMFKVYQEMNTLEIQKDSFSISRAIEATVRLNKPLNVWNLLRVASSSGFELDEPAVHALETYSTKFPQSAPAKLYKVYKQDHAMHLAVNRGSGH